jgi:hypothetical protein
MGLVVPKPDALGQPFNAGFYPRASSKTKLYITLLVF